MKNKLVTDDTWFHHITSALEVAQADTEPEEHQELEEILEFLWAEKRKLQLKQRIDAQVRIIHQKHPEYTLAQVRKAVLPRIMDRIEA